MIGFRAFSLYYHTINSLLFKNNPSNHNLPIDYEFVVVLE